jgi:hypothetical protein
MTCPAFAVSLETMKSEVSELAEALQSELEAESAPAFSVNWRSLSAGRIFAALLASALLVVFVIWAIDVTATNAKKIEPITSGYHVIDKNQITVDFTLKQPSVTSSSGVCAITALNQSFAIVGYREVAIQKGFKAGDTISVHLNTTELAVSGLVDSCWLN